MADDDSTTATATVDATNDTPTDDLGDAGKKALDIERKARRDAERQLKSAEARLKEIEDRDKSEAQKANERAEAAEAALAAKEAETLRLTVASKHGITGDYLDLLSGADEAELEAKAQKVASLIESQQQASRKGPVIPTQGDTPNNATGGETEFARALFSGD